MAFFSYLLGNNDQPQDDVAPPAYEYVYDDDEVKCGSVAEGEKPRKSYGDDDDDHGHRKPCDPCHKPKPCDPCHKPKPCRPQCEPLPPPPKPCCTPCPPRPQKPCPKPCPRPPPCRKPCNPCPPKPCDPCHPKPPHHGGDKPHGDDDHGQVGWDNDDEEKAISAAGPEHSHDSDSDSDHKKPCHKPEPVCIFNACNLVIWVSINLLAIALAFVAAVSQTTVNVLVVIFLAINLAINFLGLAGLYNNCCEYIQLAAWWQWISVPVSLFLLWQLFSQGAAAVIAILQDSGVAIIVALGNFLAALFATSPTLGNLLLAAIFVGYAIGLIVFAFEWAQAACARCVIVDCDNECGWFKMIIELIGSLIPVPTSIITLVFDVLASLCSSTADQQQQQQKAGYGYYSASAEKAGYDV